MKSSFFLLLAFFFSFNAFAWELDPNDSDPLRFDHVSSWFCQFKVDVDDDIIRYVGGGVKIRSILKIKIEQTPCLLNAKTGSLETGQKKLIWDGGSWGTGVSMKIKFFHQLEITDPRGNTTKTVKDAEHSMPVPDGFEFEWDSETGEYNFKTPTFKFPIKITGPGAPGINQMHSIAFSTKGNRKIPEKGWTIEGDAEFKNLEGFNNGTFSWLLDSYTTHP